ncbi:S49 family peptidase [Bartonella sp. HY329]|uniref:S49 family peptidase n=1 Tax=unclassified Bartonella TaxID=2645622 RepID=UPI0021C56B2C|nr:MULTISPECIES: S49 family peptidase [unclassified Bartonella]UXM94030.1 S49 family peptidase [Bartonella sp. HY329]UXN08352.1 S49 family peptidase [Bartonella sp. HY328]
MTQFLHIAERILNRPLLLTPDKAQVILSVITNRSSLPVASRFEGEPIARDEEGRVIGKPYSVTQNGIAIISILGSLVNRGAWIGAQSGLISYEGLAHQIKTAMNDDKVQSIVLDIQSPGGEAVGCFELAAQVRQLSLKKKVIAVVNGMACSAAYAIASAANEIVTTETGICGSIGVVLLHTDFSRQLDLNGITPTLIHAGEHKADGNSLEPLTDTVKADLQAEVDMFYGLFLKHVAKGRGNRLTIAAAKRTEARTFIGEAAVEAGLADRLGTFDSVIDELSRAKALVSAKTKQIRTGSKLMDDENNAALSGEVPQADKQMSLEAHIQALAKARQEGEAMGEKKAMSRIEAITSADGIKGNAKRLVAALELACQSPTMKASSVVNFVASNIASEPSSATLANRLAADSSANDKIFNGVASPNTSAPLTAIAQQINGGKHA